MGNGLVLGVSQTLIPTDPALPNSGTIQQNPQDENVSLFHLCQYETIVPILGVPFYLRVHPLSQNYHIDVVTHVGSGVYLGISHASQPKRAEFQGCQFWGSPVFMPTPFSAERPN